MKIENIDLILNTIDNGVIILDDNLEVYFWNMWLEARTNISKADIVSKDITEFYPNIKTKKLKRKIKTALTLNSPTFYNAENNEPLLPIAQSKITQRIFDSMQESVTIVPYDIKKKLVCLYIYDDTRLSEQNHKLTQLTSQLEIEIHENKKKDKKIIEQTKLAIVGEMIGNIAHQWRQPLNTVSTAVTGMMIKQELGVLKEDDMHYFKDIIMNSTQYLSNTIEMFANFVNSSSTIEDLDVNKTINQTLNILDGVFKDNRIKVEMQFEKDMFVKASSNELSQVFLNILTNSKDIFGTTEDDYRLIKIKTYKEDTNIIIELIDTAGGIADDIKSKIFEPYFTTKHKSQGTGLGLHIVYKLITEVMKGSVFVENINTEYKNSTLRGAMFKLVIPESIKENE